jgi:hypothetical protein
MAKKYKIHVKTFNINPVDKSNVIIHFSVDDYKVEDGFIVFIDTKLDPATGIPTNKEKRFHGSNCEIEVLND